MNKFNAVSVTESGQPTWCVAVEHMGLFQIRLAAIDIRHRGTIDDHVWGMFAEDIVERVVFPEIELPEWNSNVGRVE